jgi:hypothetical protein
LKKPNIAGRATKEQVSANRSGIGHADSFAGHRARMTAEIAARAPAGGAGRLCLLGAGNAHDVDLAALAERYAEIHLVDIDAEAVARAQAGVPAAVRGRVHLHAPIDVSGVWAFLDAWAAEPGQGERLRNEVGPAVVRVVGALPGPFDVVVSCCLLTQLQLTLVNTVTDRHPAFDMMRGLTNAIHVRVLAALMGESGRALLITDLTSDATYPLDTVAPDADLGRLMSELLAAGNVIQVAHPGLLSAEIRRDPLLSAALNVRFPIGPWLWRNGPERMFLVYGLEIEPKMPPSGVLTEGSEAAAKAPARDIVQLDDVIPRSYQDLVEAQTEGLAWYFRKDSASPELGFPRSYGGFFHTAYDLAAPQLAGSPLYAILAPLLFIACDKAHIPVTAVLRVRLGLFTQTAQDIAHHNPHVDLCEPHRVGLYHVADSDGDTVLFHETCEEVAPAQSAAYAKAGLFREATRIAPRKGRMAFFDGRRYRAGMHPRAHQTRLVVMFAFR